ncbi:MAG: DUF1223 domain-containing protein [Pseudomonadota bacterium]
MRLSAILLSSFAISGVFSQATADPKAEGDAPVLAELFTSQSCSSCPPAETFFSDLAEREDLVVIEWHVDYWDDLVHGRDGNWVDPFSSPYNTIRQRDYNLALRGMRSVYTPQAVIGGVGETTGSQAHIVNQLIANAPTASASIEVASEADTLAISVSTLEETSTLDAEVMLVTLLPDQSTDVLAGENKGRFLQSRNVAIASDTLGAWTGKDETYRAPLMAEGYRCAIIVQEPNTGRVLGVSYCDTANSSKIGRQSVQVSP